MTFPRAGAWNPEEVRRELHVDQAIRLQHLLEDDVRVVRVDEFALKLVQGADETRERLEDFPVKLLHLGTDERGGLFVQGGRQAIVQRPGPPADVADGLEAHRDVSEDEGDAVAVVVDEAVEEPAEVGEHHLRLGPVEHVVADGQHAEHALGDGHHVSARGGRRPGPDVNHVVGVAEEPRHVPGGEREDPELMAPAGQRGDGLHCPDFLVGTLGGDDQDALAVEGVLEHPGPEHAGGLPAPGLPDDVAVRRSLPRRQGHGPPVPPAEAVVRREAHEGVAWRPAAELGEEVHGAHREGEGGFPEGGPGEAGLQVAPADDGGAEGDEGEADSARPDDRETNRVRDSG